MTMKPTQETVSETQSMRILGSTSRHLRQELRKLPHQLIPFRSCFIRRYNLEDVTELRRARAEIFKQEIQQVKNLQSTTNKTQP